MPKVFNLRDLASTTEISIDYLDENIAIITDAKLFSETHISARLQTGTLTLCTCGKAQFQLNGKPYELHANQILLCPSHTTLSDFLFSADFEFKALLFTDYMLQSLLHERMGLWHKILYQHHLYIIDLPTEGESIYPHFFELLYVYIHGGNDLPFRADIIQSLLSAAFLSLCGVLKQYLPEEEIAAPAAPMENSYSSAQNLFQRFLAILTHTELKHQPIQYYADLLFVSPKYLSTVCKQTSGKTASQWIIEFTLEDIRYQLLSTNHTLKEIANHLGFPNSSFFGKFVKQHFGVSPRALREKVSKINP